MSDVDIFSGLTDESASSTSNEVENEETAVTDAPVGAEDNSVPTEDDGKEDPAVETVSDAPEGAMGVTEFAAFLTHTFMKETIEAGGAFDTVAYIVPQAVYQTVKAAKDRIPHVIVLKEGETEGKVYILRDEALEWWRARRERLATRGTGISKSASQRTPEDNMVLLRAAVAKHLYAESRRVMWTERAADGEKLVAKYQGFLADAKVSDDDVAKVIQEATDVFNAEMAEKAKVKEASKKSTKKTEEE